MFTAAQLIAAGVGPTQAKAFIDPLNDACQRFGIDTPARVAGFLGQVMVESALLVHVEENLFYTTPERLVAVWPSVFRTAADAAPYCRNPQKLANRVYANKNGNGLESSGDGWAFHGRGLIQLTGRGNYASAALGTRLELLAHPETAADLHGACLTAAWFWFSHKLNASADVGDIDAITRAVNGPRMLYASLRRQYTQQALAALH